MIVVVETVLSTMSPLNEAKAEVSLPRPTGATPELNDYQEAVDTCGLKIKPVRVWDSVSGTAGEVIFHIIRPDMLLVEGNSMTIPIVLKTDSDQSHTLDVSVRSVPFALLSTDNNQEVNYEVSVLTSAKPEVICHEFKATWDGRWSIIVALGNEVSKTLEISVFNRQAQNQFNQANSTAIQLGEAIKQTHLLREQVTVAWAVGIAGIIALIAIEVTKSPRARGFVANGLSGLRENRGGGAPIR
jgi:hypothetical protein